MQVYDISSQTWHTFADLPAKYHCSDNAGFGLQATKEAIFVGGYNATYGMLNQVLAIDTVTSWNTKNLTLSLKAGLHVARGDVAAAIDQQETYAIVTGGYGPIDQFCEPLNITEYYNVSTNTWTIVAPLPTARSDLAAVEVNDRVYAMGGERSIPNICSVTSPTPGDRTLPVSTMQVFLVENNTWQNLSALPYHRFRWAAVGYDPTNTIYTFGGQIPFDSSCMCLRTSNDIGIYHLGVGGNTSTSDISNNHNHSGVGTDGAVIVGTGGGTLTSGGDTVRVGRLGGVASFLLWNLLLW